MNYKKEIIKESVETVSLLEIIKIVLLSGKNLSVMIDILMLVQLREV